MTWGDDRTAWRYWDDHGLAWPGGSEVAQLATFSPSLPARALEVANTVGTPTHLMIEGMLWMGYHGRPVQQLEPGTFDAKRCGIAVGCWMRWHVLAVSCATDRRAPLDGLVGPEGVERPFWSHSGGVAGKIDALWRDQDGRLWVVDWKTSGDPRGSTFRRLLPKYRAQVAAYLAAAEEELGEPVAGGILVVLPSNQDSAEHDPNGLELAFSRQDLAPELAMVEPMRRVFWARVQGARRDGDMKLAGYPLGRLRPVPDQFKLDA